MSLIVQKFGGTSVGSVERIVSVAQRVSKTAKAGNSIVVVVSAMGKTTDGLVKLAAEISKNPCRREMDMLLSTGEQVSIALVSMALQELGQPAISLTGAQVGIVTEAEHTRARILHIHTERLTKHLQEGKVVVVAGFQGISRTDALEITTLGRGGSDTSAVAIAAALKADFCEIYTDVPGILTTDPRLVPEAQLMSEITCDEMLELASLGAKVLHPRAVEIARNYGVPLVVRSSWTDDPGTWVTSPPVKERSLINLEIARPVDSVESDTDQAKVALLRVPDRPGVAARLFGEIARQDVDVDLIIQSIHEGNTNDIAFTVFTPILPKAEAVAAAIAPVLRSHKSSPNEEAEVMVQQNIAKVSIAGAGMIGRPGVAAKMFATLAAAGVNIQMISTSEIKVSCVIAAQECDRAVAALRQAFEIAEIGKLVDDREVGRTDPITPSPHHPTTPPVRGVALDMNQARLAIRQVQDRPGTAGKLFGLLADNNISVDMIIQSQRCHIVNGVPMRDIAFTVARMDAEAAQKMLQAKAAEYGWGEVALDQAIAKVSIVGAGMVGQPGVAAKMFEALAQHNINIQMIATSEIKISCVVAQEEGVKALQVIHAAFGLAGSEKFIVPA
ncbi:aspartate kinase [Fischerella thermalis CCMEE 5273]|jgi:aspartate kinase|uniref:aspartate kinase n=5 Tax=Fischerella TaxID=1190 RepID=G6FY62_9CYAN|nr:aspartate kinase [Fischerella thermalis]PMB00257.1 aspartate kinase [Fischerella thermalis CCMEE 5328]PMB11608.1 aspartate kinase [Fischerella thermalis CCMEE 5273]EHC09639.1 aspartate kinase [Fischerella thermalis JSC-11]MBF2061554.1 aspartate kinase [Fischerella thermalis M66_A2018_004]PLZ06995.1 aspartate kinase [Fischerella thermalis WC119]